MILKVIGILTKFDWPITVERYSLKYVNLVERSPDIAESDAINLQIKIGNNDVKEKTIHLQVQRKSGEDIHILTLASNIYVNLTNGKQIFGTLIDVDSIRPNKETDFKKFVQSLENGVDDLRKENKALFFSCLTDVALKRMEPSYEQV